MISGYIHPRYAYSFSEMGRPVRLRHSGGWVLERSIFQTGHNDAMGIYPYMCCRDWGQIDRDLEELQNRLVSLVLVTDPLGDFDPIFLKDRFTDLCRPFKTHYVVDLSRYNPDDLPVNHKRNIKKNSGQVKIEVGERPPADLDTWQDLYDNLVRRHKIAGMLTFSRSIFKTQLQVPGLYVFKGFVGDETAGMLLWYRHRETICYHLGAFSPLGYKHSLSFVLFDYAIRYFQEKNFTRLNLGGGAGTREDPDDGLARFKRGWSNQTFKTYLCGKIFDRTTYDRLSLGRSRAENDYFPTYREGEFSSLRQETEGQR